VSTKTGYILETEAKDIESGADLALWDAAAPTNKVGSQRMISGEKTDKRFVLSRTDNILATDTLTYDARAVPLGYPKDITGALGFSNPARAV
jgi:hypothetical protein